MSATVYPSVYSVICDAMVDAGKLRTGNEPNAEDITRNFRRLQKLLNFYQTQGLKLWLIENLQVGLTAGQAIYTFGPTGTTVMPKPLRVLAGTYVDLQGNQRPLTPMAWQDYITLANQTDQGSINSYFVDKQLALLRVAFWLTPDAFTASNGSVYLLLEQQCTNLVQLTDNMIFPIEWGLLLEWGLANQISTGQPNSVIARCAAMEAQYREALENWDVEDAPTSFWPDSRTGYSGSRFR